MRMGRLVLGLALVLGAVPTGWAGRPLTVDDADPTAVGSMEVEAGAAHEYSRDCDHWDFPVGVAVGVVNGVEAGAGFGGVHERRSELGGDCACETHTTASGFGDLFLGAKLQFWGACPLGARHALAPSVKLPTADEDKGLGSGETDADLLWIASRALGDRVGLHLNAGYSWMGDPAGEAVGDVVHYGLALDVQVLEAVQWVAEVFVEDERQNEADIVSQAASGLRWCPCGGLTLDVAGSGAIAGDAPDYTVTAGLTWALDFGGSAAK